MPPKRSGSSGRTTPRRGKSPAAKVKSPKNKILSGGVGFDASSPLKSFDPSLHVAVSHGDMSAIKEIIASGFNVNTRDYEGRTALHLACSREDDAAVKYLINHAKGIDVNAKDRKNKTPVMDIPRSNAKMVEFLTHSGAVDDKKYFEVKEPNENTDVKTGVDKKEETAEVVDKKFFRKLFSVIIVPFIILIFYNGLYFAVQFLVSSLLFYFVCSGYFVADVTIKPPWYHNRPGAKELTFKDLPDYWGAHVHDPNHNFGLEFEDVEFKNASEMTIRGWYVPCTSSNNSRLGLILVHGGGRDRRAWLRHIPMLHRQGYSCLLFDLSEHGLSDGSGRGLSYGMRERYDVSAAAKWMKEIKGFSRIACVGTSVGGSSVIMAAALDKNIDVIVAENPILTCAHLQDKHMINIIGGYFSGTIWSNAVFRAFRFGASNWLNFMVGNKPSRKCQSMHVIGKLSPRPVLLMHGTYDDVVPPYHSERLFELAKEPKELWMCAGARHCMLQNVAPQEFEERLITFLKKYEH